MSDPSTTAFDAGTTAIQTAAEAAAAQELARAADTAALLSHVEDKLQEHNDQNKEDLKATMLDVLGDVFGKEQSTYIVKNRVPLLCQSVVDIKATILEIKDMILQNKKDSDEIDKNFVTKDGQYFLVRVLVFSGAGIVLTAALGAMLSFVFTKH